MFAKVKEQQDRQEQKQDKILDSMEKAANKKTNEFKVYPQAGSTANVGCQMQSPEFKVIPPSTEQQTALESQN
jgi:endo-alpha-1,4-polygalactosaminidase (GH114 family)